MGARLSGGPWWEEEALTINTNYHSDIQTCGCYFPQPLPEEAVLGC